MGTGDDEGGHLLLVLGHARIVQLVPHVLERGDVVEAIVDLDARLGGADGADQHLRLGKSHVALELLELLAQLEKLGLLAEMNVERETSDDGHWETSVVFTALW